MRKGGRSQRVKRKRRLKVELKEAKTKRRQESER
jgi:hypothetical protein